MKIAILLYDRFTALDAIGPYEVLRLLPGAEVEFVAKRRGPVAADSGALTLVVEHDLASVSEADVVVVPGGPGQMLAERDEEILGWLRAIHPKTRWTTSVCTGSLVLGAAGLLRGLRATSHWYWLERLREYGAEPTLERVVEQGKVMTAAGVSSGIDMALRIAAHVAGEDAARGVQLIIEYDPEPPFDAGSPKKAPTAVLEMTRQALAMFDSEEMARAAAAS